MDKYIKYVCAIVKFIAVLAIVIYIGYNIATALIIGGIFPIAPDYSSMERHFNENYANMLYISNKLLETDYDYIVIREDQGKIDMFVASEDERKNVKITDEQLKKDIDLIYHRGFNTIFLNEYKNVEFCKWSSLSVTRGIVYSINDSDPKVEWQTEIRSLSIPNWYYYESSYEKWQMLNK